VNAVGLKSARRLSRANGVDDLVSLAMEEGLERCLLEIAKFHQNKTGQWLDAIEFDVLTSLKGSLAAGAGVAPDASSVANAAQQMETFFKEFRDSLEKE
jgi:hypothetical protein